MKVDVKIGVDAPSLGAWKEAAKSDPTSAGLALDAELGRFEDYLEAQGMSSLGRFERQILTEYLGWKLVNTGG